MATGPQSKVLVSRKTGSVANRKAARMAAKRDPDAAVKCKKINIDSAPARTTGRRRVQTLGLKSQKIGQYRKVLSDPM
jgi:hypothetical protein